MADFEEGYTYFEKYSSAYMGAEAGHAYVHAVQQEIDKLTQDMNAFAGFRTDIASLKGDVAEFWHSGTHNIDAVVKGAGVRTHVDRSHGFSSPDITGSDGLAYGLKYYKSGEESAKAQAVSIFQRYKEYEAEAKRAGRPASTYEQYLKERGYDQMDGLHDPVYTGQVRIIPKDQMEEAIAWLERKIREEGASRPEQVRRYQETLDLLRDRIRSSEGTESIPLSKEDSERIARLAKEGQFNPEEFGLTTDELIQYKYVLQQAFKAGMSAAVIAMVLRMAPEIYKAIAHLIHEGKIDAESFRRIGFAAVSSGAEGFIRGSVSAAVTTACQAGLWGAAAKSVNPAVIAAVTVVVMDTMKNAFLVAVGRMERAEMIDALARNMYISTCSLLFGGLTQSIIHIPVLGFMIGSFVGSIVGAFTYSAAQCTLMSFCVDTGFTMFGLVEQDYRLPDEVLQEMGIDRFEFESFGVEGFEAPTFDLPSFEVEAFDYPTIGMTILRRGVIGIHRVGYI